MPVDTRRVVLDFQRSASIYEREAQVQYQIMSQLADLFLPYVEDNSTVLDIGCGTGWLKQVLEARHIPWNLMGLDIAAAMCAEAGNKGVKVACGNAQSLPFADNSVDAIFSSLCVQWLEEPHLFMREAARVVKPGGRIAVATLGQETLIELRDTFARFGEESRVMAFRSEFDWRDMAVAQKLSVRHMHSIRWKYPYRSMLHLCQSLRDIGAMNKRDDRRRSFTGASLFERAKAHYDTAHARPSGEHKGKAFGGGVWASWQPLLLIFEKPNR